MKKPGYVYILSNKANNVLYIGVTADLYNRVNQHKSKAVKSFTQRYNVTKLVYYEEHEMITEAIVREKQLKAWKRAWKNNLIEENNPLWRDLSADFIV